MKTSKTYYHNGQFLFLEGDGWNNVAIAEVVVGYEQALASALERAVPFEDKEKIAALAWRNDERITDPKWSLWNWKQAMLKEGLYTIPEIEVDIIEAHDFEKDCATGSLYSTSKFARILPSFKETKGTLNNTDSKEESQDLHDKILKQWKEDFGRIDSPQMMDAYTVSGFIHSITRKKSKK